MAGDATGSISNWAGGGASVTLGAFQTAYGLYKQKRNKRPTYEIPAEIAQNLTAAQQDALQGLPEEQKQQYIQNLQRGSAAALSAGGSRKGGLAGIQSLNQQQNDAYGNLLAMDSQARMQNKQNLYAQRQNMADYKNQAFQFNKVNPYYEATAQNTAMIGAGMQNMSQGFQSSNSGGDYGKQQQQSPQMASGNQYYTPDSNSRTGMKNYNPNTQENTIVKDNPYNSYGMT